MRSNCTLFHRKQVSFEGGEAETNLCYLRCWKLMLCTVETSEVSSSTSQAKNCGVLTRHSSISNHYMPISFDLLPMLNFTSCLLCIGFDTCLSLVSSSVHSKHQFIFFRIDWCH